MLYWAHLIPHPPHPTPWPDLPSHSSIATSWSLYYRLRSQIYDDRKYIQILHVILSKWNLWWGRGSETQSTLSTHEFHIQGFPTTTDWKYVGPTKGLEHLQTLVWWWSWNPSLLRDNCILNWRYGTLLGFIGPEHIWWQPSVLEELGLSQECVSHLSSRPFHTL